MISTYFKGLTRKHHQLFLVLVSLTLVSDLPPHPLPSSCPSPIPYVYSSRDPPRRGSKVYRCLCAVACRDDMPEDYLAGQYWRKELFACSQNIRLGDPAARSAMLRASWLPLLTISPEILVSSLGKMNMEHDRLTLSVYETERQWPGSFRAHQRLRRKAVWELVSRGVVIHTPMSWTQSTALPSVSAT